MIHECYEAWVKLIQKTVPAKTEKYDIQVVNTCVDASPYKVALNDPIYENLAKASPQPPLPIDQSGMLFFTFYPSG